MVHFTPEKIRESMSNPDRIRNVTVCAHVDAGKSTTTDALVAKCGIISKKNAGDACHTDTRDDEQTRGITIKSTGVSMHFNYNIENKFKGEYLINLVDSPGHVDFSSEVTSALRITDGAIVLIDAIDGVKVQTKTVVRQALNEKIKPVLMINKMDRLFLEMKMDVTEIYNMLRKHIENVNVLLSSCQDDDLGDVQVNPLEDTIMFGSGYHQWGFTLGTFAKMYAPKFGKTIEETKSLMWDYYYFPERKVWSKANKSGKGIPGFVHLVLKPINKLCRIIMNQKQDKLEKLLTQIDVKISKEEMELINGSPKKLCKLVMTKWLPLSNALLCMIIEKLPSPKEAQVYRAPALYTGEDDATLRAMKACDPEGPAMMFISKMIPLKSGDSRFYAFGRLFSGTIRAGEKLKIMGPNYEYGKKKDLNSGSAQQVVTLMAGKVDQLVDVPCGNTCALGGIDRYLSRTGTLASDPDAHAIKNMKFSVSPVVRVSVGVKKTSDLKKLMDGLRKMVATDPLVQVIHEESGDIVVAGAGELHLEICLKDLQEFMGGAELVINDPVVPYRETVTMLSGKNLSKSPNSHNRLWVTVEPLNPELCEDIEEGKVEPKPKDEKEQQQYLYENYRVDKDEFSNKKMWAFGPTDKDANILINATTGTQYMSEIKDSCRAGFEWGSKTGPLCEEPMRGVKVNIVDVTMHADSIHRGMGQIMPPMRRVLMGSLLTAAPRLQEPIYLVNIAVPQDSSGGVYGVLSQRRGEIKDTITSVSSTMCTIVAELPVAESFGFDAELRGATGGSAFAQCSFSHWKTIDSDPLEEGSFANKIVKEIRKRKGLKEMKPSEYYLDKL